MEASKGVMRGQVESLMKQLEALDKAGIQLISDNATSSAGGRGVRLKNPPHREHNFTASHSYMHDVGVTRWRSASPGREG